MSRFLQALSERVLLCDGGMGSHVQALDLDSERDFHGAENCTDVLNLLRPNLVRDFHLSYLEAGSDVIQTNSFGGSPLTLGEFDLADDAFEINKMAGILAHEAMDQFSKDGRERFVLGSIGPGTKLPSLGHISYDQLESAFEIQAQGLIAGDIDGFLIETCQDPLQIKAAVNGVKLTCAAAALDLPIIVQVTVETTGTLLVGTDIAGVASIIESLDVAAIGLNCATGPLEMAEHIRWLSRNWRKPITVQPNAGLPELVDGQTSYPLIAEELSQWMQQFVSEDGVSMIGGCCGTTSEHIAALNLMLRTLADDGYRPSVAERSLEWVPSLSSLYGAVSLRQERAYFSIGERCNANGSKKFRELQEMQDWDGCVAMGREQVREGSHAIDICTAFVGRDEIADMVEVVSRIRGALAAPLVFDSTELPVLEAALKLYGGKSIINSINFEDGEQPAHKRLALARKFGAGVIALTIDESGMAKTVDRKLEIAKRLYDFAVNQHGLPPEDLLFDPLTFTICTGNSDDRRLGLETLEAIEIIARELPQCQIILGLSNISFGLNAAARHVLNSVFLDRALERGLTGAILHSQRIVPVHAISEEEVRIAEDLIFDQGHESYNPLMAYIDLFEGRSADKAVVKELSENIEERLAQRIVDGDRLGLDEDLTQAMEEYTPLDIINRFLLDGMKVVGELFGAGKMQLPFVLQSAETMKVAVAFLEPHMDRVEGQEKATIVLATVKGDVHDIGKNLVDIILTNNGYRVINLGIKQPIGDILEAARENNVDAIGLSGLLVKSTVVMRENLEEMTRQQLDIPVVLGGAALTRAYVEEDCVEAYGCGRVAYARDAFDGLAVMARISDGTFDAHVQGVTEKRAGRPTNRRKTLGVPVEAEAHQSIDPEFARQRRREYAQDIEIPQPPFWGSRIVNQVPVKSLVPYLNERMLYQFHWGYRKDGKRLDEYMEWAKVELRPILNGLLETAVRDEILKPQAVYGFWRAAAEGNDIILFEEDGASELGRFSLPRQMNSKRMCIADFLRDVEGGPADRDVIGLQIVTMGQKVADIARDWFADDRYKDYLYLHGLGVEMTEAMAEYIHKRVRAELGFVTEDVGDVETLLRQGYHGSRYSFGYPACPNLEDQTLILKLLGADSIGVELSDGFQLHPEQSTSAIIVHHPRAKYFTV